MLSTPFFNSMSLATTEVVRLGLYEAVTDRFCVESDIIWVFMTRSLVLHVRDP